LRIFSFFILWQDYTPISPLCQGVFGIIFSKNGIFLSIFDFLQLFVFFKMSFAENLSGKNPSLTENFSVIIFCWDGAPHE